MPIILATQEAQIRRITQKGLAKWFKVKALSSSPSTIKKINFDLREAIELFYNLKLEITQVYIRTLNLIKFNYTLNVFCKSTQTNNIMGKTRTNNLRGIILLTYKEAVTRKRNTSISEKKILTLFSHLITQCW
jgi:hypothetical protein